MITFHRSIAIPTLLVIFYACSDPKPGPIRELARIGLSVNVQDFIWAVEGTEPRVIGYFLAAGMDPNVMGRSGQTALCVAAAKGSTSIVRFLLEAGAEPNIRPDDGETALIQAAERGHAHIVRMLLGGGANPDIQSMSGETALIEAAESGHSETVAVLLQVTKDPNVQDRVKGYTALMAAAAGNHADTVRTLINAGVKRGIPDVSGLTPLQLARKSGYFDVVRQLVIP